MKPHSITILNSFLVAISLFYTQIYITCLPSIADNLSAPNFYIQLIFTGNILCFGISQLFYGPLSDCYSRKKCLLIGLWIALIGNVLSLFSINITMLCIGQLIAGLGAGSCSVIPRAISKDILADNLLVKAISYMSIASTIATGFAPILGSILQGWLGWRSVFLCLNVFTIIALILVTFFIPETIKKIHKAPLRWKILKSYRMLFLNRWFLVFTTLNSCAYSGIIVYLMLSPFLFQAVLTYSARQNSLIYLLCASSYLLGNLLLGRLIENFTVKNILWLGITTITIGSILVIIAILLQEITAFELVLCGLLIHFGSGLITPMTYKLILSIPEFSPGISSAAINATRVLVAFIFSIFAAIFSLKSSTALAYSLGILSLACIGTYFLLSKINLYAMEEKLI